MDKLDVITGENLRAAIRMFNEKGIKKEDLVSTVSMPNSREFNIVYWKHE